MNVSTKSLQFDIDVDEEETTKNDSPSARAAETSRTIRPNDYEWTVHDRLFHEAKESPEKKVEKDVLITTLSSDTIRWIKRRRVMEAKHRVAITHYREGQLREIFDGLDFDSKGIIDLDELKNAVQYAEDELKGKRGPSFKDVGKMFEAMDEDGNGEVDYHEFMIAMTGSAKSLIDIASEQDIEKLRAKFKEYAVKKKREHFIKCISDEGTITRPATSMSTTLATNIATTHPVGASAGVAAAPAPISDLGKCKLFMSLFSIDAKPEEIAAEGAAAASGTGVGHVNREKNLRHLLDTGYEDRNHSPSHPTKRAPNSPEYIERILNPFAGIDEDSVMNNTNPTKKDLFYYQLENRIKEERRQIYSDLQKDSEARDVEARVLHEKQYIQQVRKPGPYDCRSKYLKQRQLLSPIKEVGLTTKQKIVAKLAATKDLKELRKEQQELHNTSFLDLIYGQSSTDDSEGLQIRTGMESRSGDNMVIHTDDYKELFRSTDSDLLASLNGFQSLHLENIPRQQPQLGQTVINASLSSSHGLPIRTFTPLSPGSKPGSRSGIRTFNQTTLNALAEERKTFLERHSSNNDTLRNKNDFVLELDSLDNERRSLGILTDRETKHKQQQQHQLHAKQQKQQKAKTVVNKGVTVLRHSHDSTTSVLLNCLQTPKRSHALSASMSALPSVPVGVRGVKDMSTLSHTLL